MKKGYTCVFLLTILSMVGSPAGWAQTWTLKGTLTVGKPPYSRVFERLVYDTHNQRILASLASPNPAGTVVAGRE